MAIDYYYYWLLPKWKHYFATDLLGIAKLAGFHKTQVFVVVASDYCWSKSMASSIVAIATIDNKAIIAANMG